MAWIGAIIGALGGAVANHQNQNAIGDAAAQGTNSSTAPWAAQQPYLIELFKAAMEAYQRGDLGKVAGFTGDELAGREGGRKAAGNIDAMMPQLMQGWGQAMNATDLKNNPYINDYISASLNPIQQRLQEQILPGVRSDAVSSGMYGGSRQGVGEGIALKGWQQQSGDITSGILNNAYNRGTEQQLQAMKLSPTIAQMHTLGPDILRALGLEERQMNQAQLDSSYQALQRLQGLIGGQGYGSTSHTTSPNFYGSNPLGSIFGGASSGIALYNMLNGGGGGGGYNYDDYSGGTPYGSNEWT